MAHQSILEDSELPPNTPWQFKFAVFFGVPAIICIYLVWWLTANIDNQVKLIINNQNILSQVVQAHAQNANIARDQILTQLNQISDLRSTLQQICVNTAQNSADRINCFKSVAPISTIGKFQTDSK